MMQQAAMSSRVSEPSVEDDRGPIRIHTPPPRGMSFVEPQPPAPNGIKPLAYLKLHWVMVVFLGGLLSSILAGTAWKVIPSKYTTSSMVRVFSDNPVLHAQENLHGRNDFATYIKTQAAIIRSPYVLTAALRDPAVAALPILREQADPARFLEEELKIEYQEGSEIIKISLGTEDPRACAMIVNSVQEAFFREVVDDEITRKKARLRQLEDSISKMQDEVKQKFQQAQTADVKDNETINYLEGQRAHDHIARLEETIAKLESDLQSWERQKVSLEKRLKRLDDEETPLPQGFLQSLDNDPKMQALAKKIEQKTKHSDYLEKLSGDPNLPSVLDLQRQVKEAKEEREQFRRERVEEHRRIELPHIEKKLKFDLEQAKALIEQLNGQKEKVVETLDKYAKRVAKDGLIGDKPTDFARVDIRERAKMITEMIDKANLLRLEVNAPPRVQDFQRAAVPMKKEMKKQLLGTVVAGLLGFGLVGLGVVVHESRVRRAMSLADVQKSVIGPVVGVLPARESGPNTLASAEATREGIEKTRTQLFQQFSSAGGKVIAVTSALSEEGKAFLASQLAESAARTGGRVLLVDFDLRSPSLHRLLEGNNERGLCEVMLAQVEFKDAVQVLPNGMMFVPAGTWRGDVRLALTPERLEAFLNWLRPQFDCIVLNTHPLLSVAETFLLCRHADAAVISIQRLESRMPFVARAHERLATTAPEAFGVVFQGASPEECLQ